MQLPHPLHSPLPNKKPHFLPPLTSLFKTTAVLFEQRQSPTTLRSPGVCSLDLTITNLPLRSS